MEDYFRNDIGMGYSLMLTQARDVIADSQRQLKHYFKADETLYKSKY